jgi:hypothetical protein
MEQDRQAGLEVLYREVLDLGDRARRWFDGPGVVWRAGLVVDAQAAVAVESLGTTARLLGAMAWLLDPAQVRGAPPPVVIDAEPDALPAGSPLAGTPGGEVALATRSLLRRIRRLAGAAYAEEDDQ